MDVYIIRLPRFGKKTPAILQQVVNKIPVSDVDLIHVQGEYGLYGGLEGGFYGGLKRLGRKIVTTMHAVGNLPIDRVIADASDRVIVHNKFCKKRFRFKSEIIPHGCTPSETMRRDEAKKRLGVDAGIPTVGYLGFLSEYKNISLLIEAVSKVPRSALLIGGGWHAGLGTPYIAEITEQARRLLPHRCKWLGFVPDDELATAYGAMDILCYCPIYTTESGALLMALSHGKAVIAARLAPFREKEKLGALMTFRGVKGLVKKIRVLLEDETLRASLEEGARAYAETNAWSKVVARHIELYEDLLLK